MDALDYFIEYTGQAIEYAGQTLAYTTYITNNIKEYTSEKIRNIKHISYIPYKKLFTEKQRYNTGLKIKKKYHNRIPIILESESFIVDESRNRHYMKFLAPVEISVGQFLYDVRKRVHLFPHESIYLHINNVIPNTSSLLYDLYREHMDNDLHLYIKICKQETFG